MRRPPTRGISLALALLLSGCSALGERQVSIDSDVEVRVLEGTRPVAAGTRMRPTLQADEPHVLTLTAEGYAPATVTFTPHTQGGDVAVFCLECVILLPAIVLLPFFLEAGKFAQFEPDSVKVHMVPIGDATKTGPQVSSTGSAPAPSKTREAPHDPAPPTPPAAPPTPSREAPASGRRFCSSCGAKLDEGKSFCASCGARQ